MLQLAQLEKWWIKQYMDAQAYWEHDENPKRPHAIMASGLHTNGFFMSKLVTDENPTLLAQGAFDLITELLMPNCDIKKISRVVGPQTGAKKLSEALHKEINRRGGQCLWSSPKKVEGAPEKRMEFENAESTPKPGELILPCEDVISTGGSVSLAIKPSIEAGAEILPYILVLVNRSGMEEIDGRKILALINRKMPTWPAEECPYCKLGSKAIKAKTPPENWALLNAVYE